MSGLVRQLEHPVWFGCPPVAKLFDWSVWRKSDLTQICSWKRRGGVFNNFSEICGCFPLISHLNLTSGNFSKLSYSVESEIPSVNFLKSVSLFARIGLATSCFGYLEWWIHWVRWTASSRLFICFMTNSTNTIWCLCWLCAKLPTVLPTIVFAVSMQISRWWNRQIVSQNYYKDSFDFADPWVLTYALRNASLREGECSRLISYPVEFRWTI